MTDASIFYRYNRFKKHKIKSGAGLSYCRGANTYLDSISRYGDRIFVHEIKESAYGFIATFGYDYLFLRNRLGIGPDLKYRNYSSFRFAGVDYGFHVAVNF